MNEESHSDSLTPEADVKHMPCQELLENMAQGESCKRKPWGIGTARATVVIGSIPIGQGLFGHSCCPATDAGVPTADGARQPVEMLLSQKESRMLDPVRCVL